MKSLQVVPSIYNEASGVSPAVVRMSEELAERGAQCGVHTLRPLPDGLSEKPNLEFHGYDVTALHGSLRVSFDLWRALKAECRAADILHNHSLWLMPNLIAEPCVRQTGCKLVVSPHGTLTPWSLNRSRWRKKLVWWLGQSRTVLRADCLHLTSEQELAMIRDLGIRVPAAIIPYGIDLPEVEGQEQSLEGREKTVLFLSRVHPKKGLELLLASWSELERRYPDWKLVIAGPGDKAYLATLQDLVDRQKLERVRFMGPVYGAEKNRLYRKSDLFVLPTHSENFAFVVAEAMAHGLPAVVTRGAPWPGLEQKRCGRWVEAEQSALTNALSGLMALSREERRAAGQRGRAWMAQDFDWGRSAEMMLETYRWLRGGVKTPGWVHLQ